MAQNSVYDVIAKLSDERKFWVILHKNGFMLLFFKFQEVGVCLKFSVRPGAYACVDGLQISFSVCKHIYRALIQLLNSMLCLCIARYSDALYILVY